MAFIRSSESKGRIGTSRSLAAVRAGRVPGGGQQQASRSSPASEGEGSRRAAPAPYRVPERDRLYAEMTRKRQARDQQGRNADLQECVTLETATRPLRRGTSCLAPAVTLRWPWQPVASGCSCFLLLCHCLPRIQRERKCVHIHSVRTEESQAQACAIF